jgi:CDP-paratose 2-epimerase
MLEGIQMCEQITGNKMNYTYSDTNRIGDHIWYISDMSKFKNHYPEWSWKYNMQDTLTQMFEEMKQRV